MARLVLVGSMVLLVLVPLTTAEPLTAQELASTTEPGVDHHDHRAPVMAGALDFFLPTLGYAYAGDWRRGLLPGGVRIVGVGLIVHGLSKATVDGLFGGDADCGSQCSLGLGMVVVGTVWGTVGAARTAHLHNRNVAGASVSLQPAWVGEGPGVAVGVRF